MGDHLKDLMEGAEEGAVWDGGGHQYELEKVVGNGAFGVVWRARTEEGEHVAIKKVLLDRRYHNRELQMMKVMDHPNVVRLRNYFERSGKKKDETFLHLVMDFLPETIRSVALRYHKRSKRFHIDHIKAYLWQTFRALEYIHGRRICHRDIKPDNLLCDPASLKCRLCDFGCSKVLVKGQPNVSYICSRYYRAPELMFGATEYAVAVDVWSVGTILMELLLGHLPFQGQDSTQQHLVEVMKLLGTPSSRDLQAMRAMCSADDLPKLKPFPWERIFPPNTPADAMDLAQRLLRYDPDQRLTASQALAHPFFDGAQQLVEGSGSSQPAAAVAAPRPLSRSEWDARLFHHLDELTSAGAQLRSYEAPLLCKLEAAAQSEQQPSAPQLSALLRADVGAALKAREGFARSVQRRLQHEVQLQQPPTGGAAPSMGAEAAAENGAGAELREIEREIERETAARNALKAEARDAEAEVQQLLAAVAQAETKAATSASAVAGSEKAERAEGGAQSEEEANRANTPGYGRRAATAQSGPVAPLRQSSVVEVAGQPQQGAPGVLPSPMLPRGAAPPEQGTAVRCAHTDNMGQMTPLSAYAAGSNDASMRDSPHADGQHNWPRGGSAGRGRRQAQSRLADGTCSEAAADSTAAAPTE